MQQLFDFIVRKAIEVTGADSGSLMFKEKGGPRLIMKSVVGLRPVIKKSMRLKLGQGVTGQCALHGKSIRVRDVTQNTHYIEAVPRTLSELAVPLCYEEKVLGVLNVDSRRLDAFGRNDEMKLEAFAELAVLVIREMEANEGEILGKFLR